MWGAPHGVSLEGSRPSAHPVGWRYHGCTRPEVLHYTTLRGSLCMFYAAALGPGGWRVPGVVLGHCSPPTLWSQP